MKFKIFSGLTDATRHLLLLHLLLPAAIFTLILHDSSLPVTPKLPLAIDNPVKTVVSFRRKKPLHIYSRIRIALGFSFEDPQSHRSK